jgi:hypothetical protein
MNTTIPKHASREEKIQFLKEHAPNGIFRYTWKEYMDETSKTAGMPSIEDLSDEYLKTLVYIPEIKTYATKDEIFNSLPYTSISKTIAFNGSEYTLSDETLLKLFGSLPPYTIGDIRPVIPERLDGFDFSIFEPKYPDISYPVFPIEGAKKIFEPVSGPPVNNSDPALFSKKVIESINKQIQKIKEIELQLQSLIDAFKLPSTTNLHRLEIVKELIRIKFYEFKDAPSVQYRAPHRRRPLSTYIVQEGPIHGFFGPGKHPSMIGWKKQGRLTTDSPQLQFARSVGGLILYLILNIKPEILLNRENSERIYVLFIKYAYKLLFTTMDGITIQHHLKLIAEAVNRHVNADFIVFDCENNGETERCPRGLILVESPDGHYRLIFTDVGDNGFITEDNQVRIIGQYLEKPLQKIGGRRKRRRTRRKLQKRCKTRRNRL